MQSCSRRSRQIMNYFLNWMVKLSVRVAKLRVVQFLLFTVTIHFTHSRKTLRLFCSWLCGNSTEEQNTTECFFLVITWFWLSSLKLNFFVAYFYFIIIIFFSWEKYVVFSPGYLWSCCVDQSSLELTEIYLVLPLLKRPSKRLITFGTSLGDWENSCFVVSTFCQQRQCWQ